MDHIRGKDLGFPGKGKGFAGWILLIALGCVGGASAQNTQPALRLSLAPDKIVDTVALKAGEIFLRPNVENQSIYLFVDNPTANPLNGTVQLSLGGNPPILTKVAVPAKGIARVEGFPKPAPMAPAVELTGIGPKMSPSFQVTLLDAQNKILKKQDFSVKFYWPVDYLESPTASFSSKNTIAQNQWSVALMAKKDLPRDIFNSPCPVKLVLSPDLIPGLIDDKPAGGGVLQDEITVGKPSTKLEAINLPFKDGTDSRGMVYLTVDGFERAFIFANRFAAQVEPPATPQQVTTRGLRIDVKPYVRPGKLAVRVEVDAPLRDEVTVELGLNKTGKGDAYEPRTFDGPRDKKVTYRLQPDHLQFATLVKDWSYEWPIPDISGTCTLRARLINNKDGKPIAVRTADNKTALAVIARVTVLDHKPVDVQLVTQPAEVPQGEPSIKVTATCKDPAKQIDKVVFFVGTPVKPKAGDKSQDEKPPEGAELIPGKRIDDPKSPRWEAKLPIPSDKQGAVPVSVQVINMVGMSSFKTAQLRVVAPPPPPNTGTIVGKVVKGNPPLAQPGLTVSLRGDKNKEVKKSKTDKDGNYQFKDVPPGDYTVVSADPSDKVQGKQSVTVEKGSKTEASDIVLKRF